MRMVRLFAPTLLLVSSIGFAAPLAPQSAVSAGQPQKVTVSVDALSYFNGSWSGKGKFTTGGDLESELSFAPDPGTQSVIVRAKEKPPNTFQFVALLSMDSISGELVMLMASNHNSGARVLRSPGWQSEKIVFQSTPELRARFALERFTFERKSETVFDATYEMSRDNGKTWLVGDRQTFARVD